MHNESQMAGNRGLKQLIALLGVAFVVSLAVVVGTRMSSDAIAVLVGVIAGVAASIPTALLLMVVTQRRAQEPPPARRRSHRSSPPVIVVAPGNQLHGQHSPYLPRGAYEALEPSPPRQFRIMGYEDEDAASSEDVSNEPQSWFSEEEWR
jgi:hypothetical protein